jgi:RNA polymerase sigma-70 factor (ECF subfamily)
MTQGGQALINWLALRRTGRGDAGVEERERAWTAEALHQRYLADVFAYVARRVPDRHEAEDVTAEVFAAAFVALPGRSGAQGPYPWLLGIARRKVADSLRRRGRQAGRMGTLTDDLPTASRDLPEAALAREERGRLLRGMLAALPEDQREALLLHYVEDLPQAEMAVVLGRSPGAVNSLLQRARAAVYRQGHDYFLGESEANK